MRSVGALPYSLNPPDGYLASGNNRPAETDIHIGYFFSPDDRVERMASLIGSTKRIEIGDLKLLQRDVFIPSSVALVTFC